MFVSEAKMDLFLCSTSVQSCPGVDQHNVYNVTVFLSYLQRSVKFNIL